MTNVDLEIAQNHMINDHIIGRGIYNPNVINAFKIVKRHLFVPEEYLDQAYEDHPLSIGYGQTISQPYIVAEMTNLLEISESMTILEIGTGSGYQTAILAELAKKVYSIERIDNLAQNTKILLQSLGYENIYIKSGDGTLGWQEYAPYDRVIVTAGGPKIPQPLIHQLNIDGILLIPVGSRSQQTLHRIKKISAPTTIGYELKIDKLDPCIFVPLIGQYA